MEHEEIKSIRERLKGVETAQAFMAGEMTDVRINVTNHLPHQISDLSSKFDEKFDKTFNAIKAQIDQHTKFDETTYARRDNSWAEKAIMRAVWVVVGGVLLACLTFIINGGLTT